MVDKIFDETTQDLITLIEESTRASQITARFFIEPAPGTLARAKSRRHHITFGRRGSGKSSLLNKIHAENLIDRTPSAFVDLEKFKGHTYPDLLLSIMIETFSEFQHWLDETGIAPASKTSMWERITSLQPKSRKADKKAAAVLSVEVKKEIDALEKLLHAETVINKEVVTEENQNDTVNAKVGGKMSVPGTAATSEVSSSQKVGSRNYTERSLPN